MDFIEVRKGAFSVAEEFAALRRENRGDGACVMFVGSVRDFNAGAAVRGLKLEHYPGMTEKSLQDITADARAHWPLGRVRLLHRVGPLALQDDIVFVGVTSPHRQAAFAACQYIMDRLKTEAPFWKQESSETGDRWVAAREIDKREMEKWG
ncbi:molybdopterin synthase subunit MoaE [Microbulbifer thermotolerans]|uniref:molybdopterin synthase catalytic subunit MoaE n=1 Tax=Microbulbifer thermotolerans TaxID=252514 RepID=UPI0008E5CF35|nr:molybdopterin synthase catalytic subunit MoaE [Microbulbifer thermotolerans]SFC89417.1 molybdopterin synthase subunit MoaE [Microbulbifer thermotolerans]